MAIKSPIIFNHLSLSKLQIHLTQKTLGSKTTIKAIKKAIITKVILLKEHLPIWKMRFIREFGTRLCFSLYISCCKILYSIRRLSFSFSFSLSLSWSDSSFFC